MFRAYTPIEECVGKEIQVRSGGEVYVGMLAGVYQAAGMPILVLTPMAGGGVEHHIPLANAIVSIQPQ